LHKESARTARGRRPAPGGNPAKDYPFLATPIDLATRGFVEEEYFVEGEACRYNGVGLSTATVRDCGWDYRTRIIVRRPASAAAFNGTVIAEWQNVTAQYEVDHYWLESSEHIMREGYAWVGVSAQRLGIQPNVGANPLFFPNVLRNWSPARYGTLDVTAAGQVADDALSYGVFSQAVQALRAPAGTDPLGPLDPEVVIAVGTSQSGSRLALHHNSVWPLTQPVVDAYFIGESRGAIRTDLSVPVLRLLSEVDTRFDFKPLDAPNYRHWEVAGASHADAGFIENIQPLLIRDRAVLGVTTCRRNPLSRIPKRYTYNAAWNHMDAWVRDGVVPPVAPRITYNGATIARDQFGNALGGIRLSEHAVATTENSATNSAGDANPGSQFCGLFGTHVPFTPDVLASLYRNHGSYVSQVVRVNTENVRAGLLLPADRSESNTNASSSSIGKR
jgi:hypothetical protein